MADEEQNRMAAALKPCHTLGCEIRNAPPARADIVVVK